MTTIERRRTAGGVEMRQFSARGLEVRSGSGANTIKITGSPIVYNTPYKVRDKYGEFQETMLPGVASAVLKTSDVRFLFNHDSMPMARSASGTLKLRDTPTALTFEADIDTRQNLANDLAIAIERRDVTQMSCGFIVATDSWNASETQRSISSFADLLDVSAVTYPASPTTTIALAEARARQRMAERAATRRGGTQDASLKMQMLRDELALFREQRNLRAARELEVKLGRRATDDEIWALIDGLDYERKLRHA